MVFLMELGDKTPLKKKEIRLAFLICRNGHGGTFSENEAFVPSQSVH